MKLGCLLPLSLIVPLFLAGRRAQAAGELHFSAHYFVFIVEQKGTIKIQTDMSIQGIQ